jgi:hypothetical protein
MICTIMRDDNVAYEGGGLYTTGSEAYEVAQRFFTHDQLNDMEDIFENWYCQSWTHEDWVPSRKFSAESILTLLMECVVDTKGEFSGDKFGPWLKHRLEQEKQTRAAARRKTRT